MTNSILSGVPFSGLFPLFCAKRSCSFRLFRALLLALFLCGSLACASGSGGDDDDDDDSAGGGGGGNVESSFSISAPTNASGVARAQFQLASGTTKFAITAFTPSSGSQVRFRQLVSDGGANYLNPGGQELSFATFFSNGVNAVNAPSRDVDPEIDDSAVFTVELDASTASGAPLSNTELALLVSSRADGNLSSGRLRVNLFFVGDVGADESVRQVVDLAVAEFRSIYSSELGISLDIQTFDIEGPLLLPSPFDGAALYAQASSLTSDLGVNIFVSGDIADTGGEVLGIAGGIIAPPVPSARSALAVGIFPGAGPDGTYSNEDIRVLGETFAHETGHYVGLFHPVDFTGQTASATDPLSDTDSCQNFTGCLANNSLVQNLMFVTPVSNGQGGTIPQNQLTEQQRGVVNRYAAVN